VKIPTDAILPDEKLTRYLLVHRARNDKSKFLARAGFTQQNPQALAAAIRSLIEQGEAVKSSEDEYGTFYQAEAQLLGTNGFGLSVVTIWLERKVDGQFRFVTLIPRKES